MPQVTPDRNPALFELRGDRIVTQLTLRDAFALAFATDLGVYSDSEAARRAYLRADAFLAERLK